MSTPALRLAGVAKRFARRGTSVQALDHVTLELVAGEIVGLAGPNGAGKTTLLRLAAGCLAPDAGSVSVFGAGSGTAAARALVGFAPDGAVFPPTLTVRETLDYYARLHVAGPARGRLVSAALELGGLGEVARQRAAHLSRGFVQRLALAQAALGDRRVLLLDETLSGIDPVVRRSLCDRLQTLAQGGVAILLSSHDLAALERLAGRVVVLRRGAVAREGALAALLRERVLEVVVDAPVAVPPGFRLAPAGLECDLGDASVESALAICRAHRLVVRATRVRLKSLEDVVLDTLAPP